MASPILNRMINQYAIKLKHGKKFPAYASGAEYLHCKKVAHSGDIEDADFVDSLRTELEAFGPIGKKYNRSSIGYCAEAISVNRVLKIYPSQRSKLSVGIAIRPKTLQRGKKCKICKTLF